MASNSADNGDQVAHIQPRRLGDDDDVVKIADEDIERNFTVEGVGVCQNANAGDADTRS